MEQVNLMDLDIASFSAREAGRKTCRWTLGILLFSKSSRQFNEIRYVMAGNGLSYGKSRWPLLT